MIVSQSYFQKKVQPPNDVSLEYSVYLPQKVVIYRIQQFNNLSADYKLTINKKQTK